jgi:hypothetical protein
MLNLKDNVNLSLCLIKHNDMTAYGGVEAYLYAFLFLVIDGDGAALRLVDLDEVEKRKTSARPFHLHRRAQTEKSAQRHCMRLGR